jgi:hypothetical protein
MGAGNMKYALAALAGLVVVATAPAANALTVEVALSSDFQQKLEEDYGTREAQILSDDLVRKVERTFDRQGVRADRVVVTLEDARPNRPTMEQVSDRIGLDPIRSISIGGAKLTGVAYDAAGREIGRYDYKWFETDISQVIGVSTWHDANTAFSRFAHRFAGKLAQQTPA